MDFVSSCPYEDMTEYHKVADAHDAVSYDAVHKHSVRSISSVLAQAIQDLCREYSLLSRIGNGAVTGTTEAQYIQKHLNTKFEELRNELM